jgi:hypothetical protein
MDFGSEILLLGPCHREIIRGANWRSLYGISTLTEMKEKRLASTGERVELVTANPHRSNLVSALKLELKKKKKKQNYHNPR